MVQYLIVGTASGLKSSIVAGLIGTQTRPKRIESKDLKIKNLTNQKSYTIRLHSGLLGLIVFFFLPKVLTILTTLFPKILGIATVTDIEYIRLYFQ